MAKVVWEKFWVFPMDGDELPIIGSGFRVVDVAFKRKNVHLRVPATDVEEHISYAEWNGLPHLANTGQPLSAVLNALRNYQPQLHEV